MSSSELSINTIRFLAIDAVQKAASGHPGAPMGAAPMMYVVWRDFLRHNPKNPSWINRDRFVLSMGHASMLQYALLHLTGYDVSIDDIKSFRQLGSITPGHPERLHTPGVEVTTGPLGQGISNGVGLALAECILADTFNTEDAALIDHYTYVLASDGDMEEGVAAEAVSLAGTWRLSKLICLYDDNGISIEGDTDLHMHEDVPARFRAYGWDTYEVADGNDISAIRTAIKSAKASDKPSLITVKTTIGFGSPNKAGSASTHGTPLGADEVAATRERLGWEYEAFAVPAAAYEDLRASAEKNGRDYEAAWQTIADGYQAQHPDKWQALQTYLSKDLDLNRVLGDFKAIFDQEPAAAATRASSGLVLQALTERLPNLFGGSADLAPSNNSLVKARTSFSADNRAGRNMHYGVREHGMAAISNGVAAYGGLVPYAATFLSFADYMRGSIRLSALSKLQVVWLFTHDSLAVGEDGPTHQPIEQLMSLRVIPGLHVYRPSGLWETAHAWLAALERRDGPTALILTRQNLPALTEFGIRYDDIKSDIGKGGYIISKADGGADAQAGGGTADGQADGTPDVEIIATGSEVSLALAAKALLTAKGISTQVVSMPCWEQFDAQPAAYRNSVLPPRGDRNGNDSGAERSGSSSGSAAPVRVSIEMGTTIGWQKYVGADGLTIGVDTYGSSAPGDLVAREYGFSAEAVAQKIADFVKKGGKP